MRRRDFIKGMVSSLAAWPLTARGQQANKIPIVGLLGTDSSVWRTWVAAFADRLRELGWIEGHTVQLEYGWSEARPERVADIAVDFIRQRVDVIVAVSGAIPIIRQATTSIPIVFPISVDPIGSGLITNLSSPSGNVTGLSLESIDLAGKRLELLRQIVPNLHRLAIIFHPAYSASALESREVQFAARAFDMEVVSHEFRRAEDLAPIFETLKREAEALYVVEDSLVSANSQRIVTLTLTSRIPAVFYNRDVVVAGGLMSYGPNFPNLFRRTAEIVDKILRGTKPADIPVEQPTKFEFVINLTTAKGLGLTVPPSLMSLADELIE
jgi:putative tryptophan/tyrosine transport system substrate-binding protein